MESFEGEFILTSPPLPIPEVNALFPPKFPSPALAKSRAYCRISGNGKNVFVAASLDVEELKLSLGLSTVS